MIKLSPLPPPAELTIQEQGKITQSFLKSRGSEYKTDYIIDTLLRSSHNKCAYCECKLKKESNYLHIEHFFPKEKYPLLVMEWTNLLPSCERCNLHKGTYDPDKDGMIVNPYRINPKHYLKMVNFRIEERAKVLNGTVSRLDLNDRHQLQEPRFMVSSKTLDILEPVVVKTIELESQENIHGNSKNWVIAKIKGLLREAQPSREYAATVATTLFTSDDFMRAIDIMLRLNMWDKELDILFWNMDSISLHP